MKEIPNFKDDHEFLSNFYPVQVHYENEVYPSVEHAFQAAKCEHPEDRKEFQSPKLYAGKAKQLGRKVRLRSDWGKVKIGIMKELLIEKFTNPDLCKKLIDTGNAKLVEGNFWHDNFWGICHCKKCIFRRPLDCNLDVEFNRLGKLLMELRSEIQKETLRKIEAVQRKWESVQNMKVACRSNENEPLHSGTLIGFESLGGKINPAAPIVRMDHDGKDYTCMGIVIEFSEKMWVLLNAMTPREQWDYLVPLVHNKTIKRIDGNILHEERKSNELS